MIELFKMSLIQIARKPFLLICFILLWYTINYFYYEQEGLLSDKSEKSLTEVHVSLSSTLSSNTTLTTITDNDDKNSPNSLEELNKKYCGKPTCKFLFAYIIGEQETKSNLHFRSFIQLAEKLNRIMILTNVESSRISTCNKFPFDFYYNTDLIQKEFPNVIFKSENDFIFWLKERDQIKKKIYTNNDNKVTPPLSILHSSIKLHKNIIKTFYDNAEPNFDKHKCISKFEPLMNLEDSNNSRIIYTKMRVRITDLITNKSRAKFSKLLTKVLTTDDEILLVNAYVGYPLFPGIMPVIPYSDYILNEAQKIKDKLSSSYIGIHWRLEQSTPELLPECVQGLIKTLNKVMKEEGINNIYLATDYPLLSSKSQSSTFRNLSHYHHDAIKTLNETFKINTWASLGGLEQLRKNNQYKKELNGSGIQGILDKLVCINSNYFISGPKGCSRVVSSFTKAIASERSNRIDDKDSSLLNIIDR
ncbi:hypothetical protein RclHR1_06310006 [Rhizophagus clarus]|uniref:GDP-fucose protein O-fucosyltransferase 2 n=1 Tax=Rhizophagus clarus TaxID=94130 RepID=A0A2Z6S8D5_9GLOM|nr:hypothetical protein RclHR1_06310006 [Rhizophagus clarus]GES82131.1 hypothetical protein GLOIN_2v1762689 [Rhizophagus clarus]